MKRVYLCVSLLLFLNGCGEMEQQKCKPPELVKANTETMSFIPGGKFIMGDKDDAFGDKPLHKVYVSSFYMDKTEVTNGMYKQFLKDNPCVKPPKYLEDPELGADELPVVGVSYKDAKKFCTFYGKRLPTEAEWEYAARGKLKDKKYPWGNKPDKTLMNYRGSNNPHAVAVKSYPPNRYGLYEMTGNVREWVEDTYDKNFYKQGDEDDYIKNPVNKDRGRLKVNRGGSWHYTEGDPATVSFRSFDVLFAKYSDLGFRCASDGKVTLKKDVDKFEEKIKETLKAKKEPVDFEKAEIDNEISMTFDSDDESTPTPKPKSMKQSGSKRFYPKDISKRGIDIDAIDNSGQYR